MYMIRLKKIHFITQNKTRLIPNLQLDNYNVFNLVNA